MVATYLWDVCHHGLSLISFTSDSFDPLISLLQFGVIIPWMGWSLLGVINIIAFNSISIIAIYSHIQGLFYGY